MKAHKHIPNYADHNADVADHVICNYCETEMLVNCGEEKCPLCGMKGTLRWASTYYNYFEVDVNKFYEEFLLYS